MSRRTVTTDAAGRVLAAAELAGDRELAAAAARLHAEARQQEDDAMRTQEIRHLEGVAAKANERATRLERVFEARQHDQQRAEVAELLESAIADGRILYEEAETMVATFDANIGAAKRLLATRAPSQLRARRNHAQRQEAESRHVEANADEYDGGFARMYGESPLFGARR